MGLQSHGLVMSTIISDIAQPELRAKGGSTQIIRLGLASR